MTPDADVEHSPFGAIHEATRSKAKEDARERRSSAVPGTPPLPLPGVSEKGRERLEKTAALPKLTRER